MGPSSGPEAYVFEPPMDLYFMQLPSVTIKWPRIFLNSMKLNKKLQNGFMASSRNNIY